jgi:hypothetical protein
MRIGVPSLATAVTRYDPEVVAQPAKVRINKLQIANIFIKKVLLLSRLFGLAAHVGVRESFAELTVKALSYIARGRPCSWFAGINFSKVFAITFPGIIEIGCKSCMLHAQLR